MPGQPISVTAKSIGGTYAANSASPVKFRVLEYGCNTGISADLYTATNFVPDNFEFNPIREKKPDGTGVASHVDQSRGRIDDIPAGHTEAD